MATRDAQTGQSVDEGLAAVETPATRKDAGRLVEFSRVLFDLTLTLNRAVIAIGITGFVAIVVAYWGAHTGHASIGVAAFSGFLLALLAWVAITCYRVWVVVTGSLKWWKARRNGHD